MMECTARARPRSPLFGLPLFLACVLLYGNLATARNLKYSRHLDSRSQFPDKEKPLQFVNHRPVFTNCSNYAPSLDEEMPRFTPVFRVYAEDIDPPENGGTVIYSLISTEKLKFDINNMTGEIITNAYIDRDEPFRELSYYLMVHAIDNGSPQLGDTCIFKVTIRDINDNEPVFDKVIYTESVPQDLPVGREVMRVSATDIDNGENGTVRYNLSAKTMGDVEYFRIDSESGIIYLKKAIDRVPGYKFNIIARATDLGRPPKSNAIDVDIRVVESHKKAPAFLPRSTAPIKLMENFSDNDATIVRLGAVSNINDSNRQSLTFELVTGGTKQTNKQETFRLVSNGDMADIKLFRPLDYEENTQYSLIVRVTNNNQLTAETVIDIEILDVNDNPPRFHNVARGSVLENEPPGVPVIQVQATDADGTAANNQVHYELDNFKDLFAIDSQTGIITTLVTFDREIMDFYNIKVSAIDNSPSTLSKTGLPNKEQRTFEIEIADKNDNPPRFTEKVYSSAVNENANINAYITQIEAMDPDTASSVTYSIIAGNINGSFSIEGTTGKIRVNNTLDYEQITKYNLTVRASDGLFNDTAQVEIFVENVNDNQPIFENFNKNPMIEEEKLVPECITTVVAYDPDIEDRNADQHIAYFIFYESQKSFFEIDKTGCMKLKKSLDRDPPNGYSVWNIDVVAKDEDASSTALEEIVVVNITLLDINDNAPFLDMPYPVIWGENKPPGKIIELKARDYDSEENGPPFEFRIDSRADNEIKTSFSIHKSNLHAEVVFDREQRKSYDIPIAITDNGVPPMTGTSTLTVIIGDENDNLMKEGSSSIFVYNYKGEAPDTEIGRVYVNDPDDWDLPDKSFDWVSPHDGFLLNSSTGMITLLSGTSNDTFVLKFIVTEKHPAKLHQVQANVNVTVKELSEEAVEKSGSVRFYGINAEQFVEPDESGVSKKEIFQEKVASMLNISVENVDVFTVLHSPHYNNKSLLDVRFSAHGSPYYALEKLNTILVQHSKEIEHDIRADILLVNIDECLFEKMHCNNSCRSYLNVSTVPYSVYTNISSFVGVRAVMDPQCTCHVAEPIVCLNGGTPLAERCECPPGLEGRRCELLSIGFHGDGWAIMPPPGQACEDSHLGLEITPHVDNSLVFYFGPMIYNSKLGIQDFMSLELQHGYAVLYIDYGTGTARLEQKQIKLTDGKSHRIDILWSKTSIELKVDNCAISACLSLTAPQGTNEFLNVNGPMQVGGTLSNLAHLASKLGWDHTPTEKGFVGCIRNMSINGNTYNLGMPSLSKNADPGCNHGMAKAVSFGIDTNFLVAILVCIAILLILLLAVVVQRRKTDLYKDMDDIRENIINYEDEGGGEVDTGYDLNVLRVIYDTPPIDSKIAPVGLQSIGADEVLDICRFLDGKKESCDKDSDTNPFDGVRHYAYEGEGNSEGDLSSLASCTDDEDLNFNYLSNFGQKFRKLADMYGEEPSDEDSDGVGERESES